MTYTCTVESSHQLLWRYTVNGNTTSDVFVFDDPINSKVLNLGPFELRLKDTNPISNFEGYIESTATSANGLTLAENGAEISCAGSPPLLKIISFAG